MKKIGLLGGSFDPIHFGHLQVAKHAKKALCLDEVWFVVSKKTPLKDRELTSFNDRVSMVKLAIKPYRKFKVCTIENQLGETSYTIDTINILLKKYPAYNFKFLIGDDLYLGLNKWKNIDELRSKIEFVVMNRSGLKVKNDQSIAMDIHPASSTLVRKGEFKYLPKSVVRYINNKGLYYDEIASSNLSLKRYEHTVSVAKLCLSLAKTHHLDETCAYISAMLHDISKEVDKDVLKAHVVHFDTKCLDMPVAFYHAYLASYFAVSKYYIFDKRIRRAIYHHVDGKHSSDYSKILYIADKIDPTRGYNTDVELKLAYKNLSQAVEYIQEKQKEYLMKDGVI